MKTKEFFAAKNVFTTRSVVFMGLMAALSAVISMFDIYLTPSLRITLNYIPGALTAMLYGPWAGLAMGFAGDLAGYIAHPMGFYFPGFALSAMVNNMIFALFFYRREVRLWRVLAARLCTVAVVDMGLNVIWLIIMYNQAAGEVFTGARLIKAIVQFPIDIAILISLGYFVKNKLSKFL